ncbi:hypothetical protein AM588_10008915 [Phytophthora nicotianae]|uniref:Uncharacterized protein n=1 Tax=Phytophthora nicotianae TaxID=4792 RepID=A0A0W8DEZ1_PHYNI|nr:hypothetical protein AM588_10008915 [Phytophthora nicotianae]
MLRGGHALQIASAKMLDAKVADFHVVKTYSAAHFEKLKIREIYASKPDMVELKEVQRDEEQEFVDAHTPDILDPNKGSQDPVTTFAKASLKMLVQVARTV